MIRSTNQTLERLLEIFGEIKPDAIRHFLAQPFIMWLEEFRPLLETHKGQDKHVLEDLENLLKCWKSSKIQNAHNTPLLPTSGSNSA